jgi:glycosyltransferase involved in cell wall biosynthesis
MSQKLVSVLTPCYNGGKYIHKLLDSVLMQTYPKVEMFVVDDGSTDGSSKIIKSYISRFHNKGYKLEYIYQKNQGQSVAINNGLKLVSGNYLVWPDADDYYADSSAISEMAKALEASDGQTSMVRVEYNVLDENGVVINKLGVNDESRHKTDLFEDAVFGSNGFWYPPGGYMAKISKIDELIPGRKIYTEKKAGQNFQLYLPLLYQQKCLTISKQLYSIVAHEDSHSRNMATNNDRQKMYYQTIKKTLDKIPLTVDYRKHLMKKVREIVKKNQIHKHNRPYRTYIKRTIKGVTPHGLIVLYQRRRH